MDDTTQVNVSDGIDPTSFAGDQIDAIAATPGGGQQIDFSSPLSFADAANVQDNLPQANGPGAVISSIGSGASSLFSSVPSYVWIAAAGVVLFAMMRR